jgi:hypothetical protein
MQGSPNKMLPARLSGPPQAIPVSNSLRVSGSEEAIAQFSEILHLLDRPIKRVELQIEVLQGTPLLFDKLQVANWSREPGPDDSLDVLRFTRGTMTELRQKMGDAAAPARLAGTTTVNNNTVAEVHLGEALPKWWSAAPAAPPVMRFQGHFLNLRLTPRLNADDSATVLVEALSVVGQTEPADITRLAPQGSRILGMTQIRAGNGETIATVFGHLTDAEGQPIGDEALLASPILLITTRAVGVSL